MDLQDNGDGTWTGRFVIPELPASSSPPTSNTCAPAADVPQPGGGPGDRPDDRRLQRQLRRPELARVDGPGAGRALRAPAHRRPGQHGRVGATVVVHLDHERLLDGLAAAHSTAARTSPSARHAGSRAEPASSLGLRRGQPSARPRPRVAAAQQGAPDRVVRVHDSCAAEGCQRPFAWCEIHHPHAWATGGRTDLDNALPLCGWHHRRAHDGRYDLRFLTSGEVRFRRRP